MKVSKGYKEGFDKLIESGRFSDLELQRIIFDDFEENYRAMRNPEKYKDPDESDKPYRERSKAARMRDPHRGINSPAFKRVHEKAGNVDTQFKIVWYNINNIKHLNYNG